MDKILSLFRLIIIPGLMAATLAASLFSYVSIIDGYGDFKLFFLYLFAFSLIFWVLSFFLFLYGKIIRLEISISQQLYFISVLVLTIALLFTVSYGLKILDKTGRHLRYYHFPRNLAFLVALLLFLWLSRKTKKAWRRIVFVVVFALLSLGVILSVTGGPGYLRASGEESQEFPNILLLTIESLRYDHLGITSDGRIKTKNLDRLARDGVFFTNYFVQAPYTTASLATLMSGCYPFHHGARAFGQKILPRYKPFFMSLVEYGYSLRIDVHFFQELFELDDRIFTGGFAKNLFTSWYLVNDYLGNLFPRLFGSYCFGSSTSMISVSRLMREIKLHKDGRWFFWTQLSANCHWPYKSPPQFTEMYTKGGQIKTRTFSTNDIKQLNANPENLKGEILDEIEAAYSAEVTCVDEQIGIIINRLKRLNLLGKTVVIITTDHGECLGEDGFVGHGESLKDNLIHVPLIVFTEDHRYFSPGQRIEELIEEVDLAPTILDLCGVEYAPDVFDGRSILPLTRKEQGERKSVYSEYVDKDGDVFYASLRTKEFKLLWDSARDQFSLFALREDPFEKRDVFFDYPEVAEEMKNDMLKLTGKKEFSELLPPPMEKIDKDMEEKLKALGYVK